MSIAGIFAVGGGCYDNDKRHYRKSRYHRSYKKDYDHGYSYGYHRSYKCYDCDDDDDDGLLGGILG